MKRSTAVRRVGLQRRPTGATGSIVKNEHPRIARCSFFAIDPIAQRRFATPVEPPQSVQPPLLRVSVVIPFSLSPLFPFPP